MRFIIIITLIFIIFGAIIDAFSSNCTDISEELKSNKLSEFERYYRKYMAEIIRTRTRPSDSIKIEPPLYRDNVVCEDEKNKNNNFLIHKRSLCPWYTKIITREDRYPSLVREVRCSCTSCNNNKRIIFNQRSHNKTYECLPVMSPSVGLKRGICDKNGIFEWTPTVESLNVACVCSLKD
jgi:hypothetical protein